MDYYANTKVLYVKFILEGVNVRLGDIFKTEAYIDNSGILSLDDVINALTRDRMNGINSYYDYNGVRLYSRNIGVESAYQQVYGKAKEEYQR